jgi:hypothetical protein
LLFFFFFVSRKFLKLLFCLQFHPIGGCTRADETSVMPFFDNSLFSPLGISYRSSVWNISCVCRELCAAPSLQWTQVVLSRRYHCRILSTPFAQGLHTPRFSVFSFFGGFSWHSVLNSTYIFLLMDI